MQLDLKFIAMEKEVWKDVIGYEGLYQVSSLGRVKSLSYDKTGQEKVLKQGIRLGYPYVELHKRGYPKKKKQVHRLVAMAFIPNPEGKPYIDHINTQKDDNRVENLQWVTCKENCNNPLTLKHKSDGQKGEKGSNWGNFGSLHSRSIPIVQLTLDGKLVREWECTMQPQRELGYSNSSICRCLKGKQLTSYGYRWMYLSDYNKESTVA